MFEKGTFGNICLTVVYCDNGYLDFLFKLSLEVFNLLSGGLLSSGQLRHQGVLLLQLPAKLTYKIQTRKMSVAFIMPQLELVKKKTFTIFSLKLCFLHCEIIDRSLIFIRFGLVFTHLILKRAAHFLQVGLE